MKKTALLLTAALFAFGTMTMMQSCSKPCKDEPCGANGSCVEDGKDYTCTCSTGWEGELCDTEERAKFIGSYTASGPYTCDVTAGGTFSGTIIIGTSATSVTKITLDIDGILLTAEVSGTSLTVDNSSVGGFDYSGSGSINGNTLTLTLTEYDDSVPEDCIYSITGSKQ